MHQVPATSLSACVLFVASLALASQAQGAQNGSFSEQTASTGIVASYGSGLQSFLAGGAVGDFNRDGWQDIFYPAGPNNPDQLLINNGDGTFTDEALTWGVADTHRSTAAAVGDFDGDGWLDIFVTSHGPASSNQVGQHKLYRNTGLGGFIDVAQAAGVNMSSQSTADGWGAAWGDMDLDGDLDLAVCGWQSQDGNRVFRNNGDGTFADVTQSAGLGTLQGMSGFAPRFCDMDGDRYPELIWVGDFGTSKYYVNNADGTFTNFTSGSGTSMDGTEMGSTIADWDEDGDWDIYVTTISTNNLYINQGGNVFVNNAGQSGALNTAWGWGAISFDMNHDTRMDLLAASQSRNFAFVNNQTSPLSFTEVAQQNGLGSSNFSGRGIANFDYDNDGDQDVIVFPHFGAVKVWRNDLSGPDTHWLRVFLERGDVNDIAPNGIGSVVKARMGSRTLMGRIDGGSNYLSQSEMSAHFGLGSATQIDELRVEWTNGMLTVLTDVASDQTLTIAPPNAELYCDVHENSAGTYPKLIPTGSASIANNNFGLLATDLPPNQFALFFMGQNRAQLPLFAGELCVGAPISRLAPALTTGTVGRVQRTLNLADPSIASLITAGVSTSFQLYYRDGPGNVANLTNAAAVTFE